MAGIALYVVIASLLMLAVGAVSGGALARSGRLATEHPRAPRMRSGFDEGNDERPYSTAG